MDASHQIETTGPTPEQLLKLLDLQLTQERGRRARPPRNRATILVAGILFIIAAASVALLVAEQMLGEMRSHAELTPMAAEMEGRAIKF